MKKLTIALLSGGTSSERKVSLKSGEQVYEALDKKKYKIIRYDPKTEINRLVADAPKIDAGLIILHGPFGEDGTVQGLLDLLGIPYQGSGVLGSALAMNKIAAKKLYEKSGLPVPPYIAINRGEKVDPEKIANKLGVPLVVKPVQGGSSIGMSIIQSTETLKHAVDIAFEQDNSILIETYIQGIEITGSVIGNEKLKSLPVVEIIPGKGHEFFDYKAKYTAGLTQEICPARINDDLTEKAQEYAETAHSALFCKGYSRTDMILKNNDIYVLETNTIPGMTPTSLLPLAAATAGISFSELLDTLIELSMRPLKNVQFCSSSRKAKILNGGIH